MVIYAGRWLDDDGVPFDPALYNKHESDQGNVGQLRVNYDPRRVWSVHHTKTLLILADLWHHDLTADQRAQWELIKNLCWSNRHQDKPDVHTGFVAFANRNWPLVWGYEGQYMQQPDWTIGILQVAMLTNADHLTQNIDVKLIFDNPPEYDEHSTSYLYHLNPAKIGVKSAWRFTRLARAFRDFNDVDTTYNIEIPAQWPLVVGDTCYVLVRHTYMYTWFEFWLPSIPVT